jgi:hypothetical protein
MTPEERADEIVDSMIRHGASGNKSNEALFLQIAASIRAAENDALERAAEAIESDSFEGATTAASVVRNLKHED